MSAIIFFIYIICQSRITWIVVFSHGSLGDYLVPSVLLIIFSVYFVFYFTSLLDETQYEINMKNQKVKKKK